MTLLKICSIPGYFYTKRLLNLYNRNKQNFSKQDQEIIENYLEENCKLLKQCNLCVNRSYWLNMVCKLYIKIKLKFKRFKYE